MRGGAAVALGEAARRALVGRVEKALAVCNFSSAERPEIFSGDSLDAQWKQREAASHLRLPYPAPMPITGTCTLCATSAAKLAGIFSNTMAKHPAFSSHTASSRRRRASASSRARTT